MSMSSVQPVPWLAVNRHHLFSDGAAFNTQREFTDKLRNIAFIIEGDSSAITNTLCPSLLVNSLFVLTAAPSENRKQVVGFFFWGGGGGGGSQEDIKYIYIWYKLYEYKYFQNICCMCV